jgi:amidohydrolase
VDIDRWLDEFTPRLIEARRHLHAHPEASREERETSRFVARQLEAAGLEVKLGRDGLGVIAEGALGPADASTPLIAIRADLDALRVQDTKTTPYASRHPGLCHACGHDAHAAIVLGVGLCLSAASFAAGPAGAAAPRGEAVAALTRGVRVRCLFQPAEETADGARWLVEQGAVDGVDAILGIHVDPERALGVVGLRDGPMTAHCDEVEMVVEGMGGHSARPHHTRDPIAAAAHLVSSLYGFLPRSVDARCPSVFSIGRMAGGILPNVIPDRVEIRGTLRTLDAETRAKLKDRIEDIVHGVRETSGTTIHLRFINPIDAVYNDPFVAGALREAAIQMLGPASVETIRHPSMGGEDFSGYLTRVPGAMIRVGVAPPGFAAPFLLLHAPDFDIDERAIPLAARILLRAALRLSNAAAPWGTQPVSDRPRCP